MSSKYYSLEKINSYNADYNIIFGERSNGKTYAALLHGLVEFVKSGYKNQLAIIRRWREDIIGKRANTLFAPHISNNVVANLTNGEYTTIYFYTGKYYLANYNEKLNKYVPQETPFAYVFSLSEMEHDKSTAYPHVKNIVFDEFLTRRFYLPDEFILFMNVLSTIIRHRDDVKIYMLGNTVNKYCPYFTEMGLKHIQEMQQGTIDLYQFGQLKIAVEYAATISANKPSNKYFAFDNDNLQMIVNGAWELAIYPHLNVKYSKDDIVFTYFIEFESNILQCEIIATNTDYFTYIHAKTTPIHDDNNDVIYSLRHNEKSNYHRRLLATTTPLETKIARFYALEKVFFQNNEIGEMVRNYIMISSKSSFAKV